MPLGTLTPDEFFAGTAAAPPDASAAGPALRIPATQLPPVPAPAAGDAAPPPGATITVTPGRSATPASLPPPPSPAAPAFPVAISPDDFFKSAPAPGAPEQPKQTGIVANIGAGTSEETAGFLGAPVDLATGAINLGSRAVKGGTGFDPGQIQNPVGGSDFWKSAFGLIGANPNTVAPADATEQIGRAAGEGAAGMLLPWAGARALPAAMGGVAGAARDIFGAGSASVGAGAGAIGGATGQIAQANVPQPYKPLASLGGNLLGGGLALGGSSALGMLFDEAGRQIGHFLAPLTTAGQEATAGQRIAAAASSPAAVKQTLADPPKPLVPGSRPTTYQITGDPGLGALERGVAATHSADFNARSAEQNAARQAQIGKLAPENSSPEAIGRSFRGQLDEITSAGHGATEAARGTAQRATDAMGGAVPAGTDQQNTALQGFGAPIREGLAKNRDAAKAGERSLWSAIDPDGTMTIGTRSVREGAQSLINALPKNTKPLSGEPKKIFDVARLQPNKQLFSEFTALRGRITDAMREELSEHGRSQAYGLLSKLLDQVHDAMQAAVESRAAQDGADVAAGKMRPEDAMAARVQAFVADWRARRAAAEGNYPDGSGTLNPGGGLGGVSGGHGEGVPGQARPGSSGSDTRLAPKPADGLTGPAFDADAAARYQAARNATADLHSTFTNAPGVGEVLAPGRTAATFDLDLSRVPAAIFRGGAGAGERVQAFLNAGGSAPALSRALQEYAAFDLRRAAEDADGTLNPAKYAKWMKAHAEAMTAFPELAQRFRTAADARASLDAVARQAVAARDAFQMSAAGKFLGDNDPVAAMGRVLNSDTAVSQMRELARLTAHDPAARAGLQRAVVEHIMRDLRSNQVDAFGLEFLKNDAFQRLVKKAADPLSAIFTPKQIQSMRDVAADLQRAQKSITATKLPGGSNTAQDTAEMAKGDHGQSALTQIVIAEAVGEMAGDLIGKAGTALGSVLRPVATLATVVGNAMRAHGLEKVDDLVAQAMLHPEIAKTLLMKVPNQGSKKLVGQILQNQLGALAVESSASNPHTPPPMRQPRSLATPRGFPPASAFDLTPVGAR